jgi:hypothetical protein
MLGLPALLPIVFLLVALAIDLWVYADAKAHEERGTPVAFSTGFLNVDTPAVWFVGCLLFWILFFALYISIR